MSFKSGDDFIEQAPRNFTDVKEVFHSKSEPIGIIVLREAFQHWDRRH